MIILKLLTNLIMKSIVKSRNLLTASCLVALEKKRGRVRPITIESLIYRVTTKVIFKTFYHKDNLLSYQLGIDTSLDTEPAITLLNQVLNSGKYTKVTSLDMINTFNTMPRINVASQTATHTPSFYKIAR
jgi:hypothetical protein